jgi:hypothetical protein
VPNKACATALGKHRQTSQQLLVNCKVHHTKYHFSASSTTHYLICPATALRLLRKQVRPTPCHLLVIVSPRSGAGNAVKIWQKTLQPMLEQAHITYTVIITQRSKLFAEYFETVYVDRSTCSAASSAVDVHACSSVCECDLKLLLALTCKQLNNTTSCSVLHIVDMYTLVL